jgi:hypothetical protein
MCASARLQDTVQPSLMVAQTRLVPQISKQSTWAGPKSAAAPLRRPSSKSTGVGLRKMQAGGNICLPPSSHGSSRLNPNHHRPCCRCRSHQPRSQAIAMRLRRASSASQHAEPDDSEQALVAACVHIQSMDWSDFCSVSCVMLNLRSTDAHICSGEPIANLVVKSTTM